MFAINTNKRTTIDLFSGTNTTGIGNKAHTISRACKNLSYITSFNYNKKD